MGERIECASNEMLTEICVFRLFVITMAWSEAAVWEECVGEVHKLYVSQVRQLKGK